MAAAQRQRIGADILIPFILLALVFGSLFWQKYQKTEQLPQQPPVTGGTGAAATVVLFFGDGTTHLVREARQVASCETKTDCLRTLLEELFSGPLGDGEAVLPEWTVINSIQPQDDLAVVDLGKDFADSLAPGSLAEMLAVYAIVNTICTNLPEIQRVQITLDGNRQVHLRHLDLSGPLEPDYSLEATAENQEKTD